MMVVIIIVIIPTSRLRDSPHGEEGLLGLSCPPTPHPDQLRKRSFANLVREIGRPILTKEAVACRKNTNKKIMPRPSIRTSSLSKPGRLG
jgi:hypothetical protein